jgi:hypothetical protein
MSQRRCSNSGAATRVATTPSLRAPAALHSAAMSFSNSNSSVARCNAIAVAALQHHCCCSVASDNAAIAGPWFVRRTFVRSIFVRPTFVHPTAALRPARLPSYVIGPTHLSSCRSTSYTSASLRSIVLRLAVLRHVVLPSTSCLFIQHLFDFCAIFVSQVIPNSALILQIICCVRIL